MITMTILLKTILPSLTYAALTTLVIASCSMALGLCGGIFLACTERSNNPALHYPTIAFVTFIQGTPLLLQLVFLYYALTLPFSALVIAIIAIGINSAVYISQTIKIGIQAVNVGEIEAAQVMGFTKAQITRYILFPQAFRAIFPSLGNEFTTLIKDSSLAHIIGVHELFKESKNLLADHYHVVAIYGAMALFYFAMTTTVTYVVKAYEKRIRRSC